jgi:hypothetical protein
LNDRQQLSTASSFDAAAALAMTSSFDCLFSSARCDYL